MNRSCERWYISRHKDLRSYQLVLLYSLDNSCCVRVCRASVFVCYNYVEDGHGLCTSNAWNGCKQG